MDERVSKSVMPDDPMRPLDDELAALTDTLLRGDSPAGMSDEAAPLLDVAHRLERLIAPSEAPSPEFERRLRAAIETAWAARTVRPRSAGRRDWVWVAAAAAVLLLAVLVIPATATFPLFLAGTAVDGAPQPVEIPWRAAILLIGLAGIGVYWMYRQRRAA
jgi:hypothetical protein